MSVDDAANLLTAIAAVIAAIAALAARHHVVREIRSRKLREKLRRYGRD